MEVIWEIARHGKKTCDLIKNDTAAKYAHDLFTQIEKLAWDKPSDGEQCCGASEEEQIGEIGEECSKGTEEE